MATPHVAGVAALLLADNPSMTVAELKTAILAASTRRPGLAPHVQDGGRLNAAKALGLVPDDSKPTTTITAGPAQPDEPLALGDVQVHVLAGRRRSSSAST